VPGRERTSLVTGPTPIPTIKGNDMSRLQDKVAVITGGASGIGLAAVQRFVAEGAFVYAFARRQEELDKMVASVGRNVASVQGDVRNLEDLDRVYAKIASDGHGLDVVVANVAAVKSVNLDDVTIESFKHNFEVNVRGVLFTVQKALPLLNNGTPIILTSTVASLRGIPGRSAYAASKTALRSYARTWTMELKDRGIRVNTVTPGPCATPLIDTEADSPEQAAAVHTKHAANIPLGVAGSIVPNATAAHAPLLK
jgi:NAD(P)-dependent dehydrogenase (short-subunit alcohol dehydrogenase family)